MSSFKLEKGGSAKQQAISAGALLIVLGIAFSIMVDLFIGGGMVLTGSVLVIGGFGASS